MHVLLLTLFVLLANVDACRHKGRLYEDGDEWIVDEMFIMRCTHTGPSWRNTIVACKSPTGMRLAVNETRDEGATQWQCVQENGMVRLKQAVLRPNQGSGGGSDGIGSGVSFRNRCGHRQENDVWTDGMFEYTCKRGGREQVTGCVVGGRYDSTRVPIDSWVEQDGYKIECISHRNGTASVKSTNLYNNQQIRPSSRPSSYLCSDTTGNLHRVGTHWVSRGDRGGSFNKTCAIQGRDTVVTVLDCINDDGYRIPVNGELLYNGRRHVCEKRGREIRYRTERA